MILSSEIGIDLKTIVYGLNNCTPTVVGFICSPCFSSFLSLKQKDFLGKGDGFGEYAKSAQGLFLSLLKAYVISRSESVWLHAREVLYLLYYISRPKRS